MKILIYPHKKFLSNMKFEIGNGTDIQIKLSKAWNTKLITPEIISLLINEKSEEKNWKYVFLHFSKYEFLLRLFLCQIKKL